MALDEQNISGSELRERLRAAEYEIVFTRESINKENMKRIKKEKKENPDVEDTGEFSEEQFEIMNQLEHKRAEIAFELDQLERESYYQVDVTMGCAFDGDKSQAMLWETFYTSGRKNPQKSPVKRAEMPSPDLDTRNVYPINFKKTFTITGPIADTEPHLPEPENNNKFTGLSYRNILGTKSKLEHLYVEEQTTVWKILYKP